MSSIAEISTYKPHGMFRLFLSLMVADVHFASLRGGAALIREQASIAVMIFFVLSAYIITTALARFYRDRIVSFLVNRALRLFPTYCAVVIVSLGLYYLLFSVGLMPDHVPGTVTEVGEDGRLVVVPKDIPSQEMFGFRNIIENIFVMPVMYGLEKLGLYPVFVFSRPFWSLKVEIAYYLYAGFIAWVVYSGIPGISSSRNFLLCDKVRPIQTSRILLIIFSAMAVTGLLLYFSVVDFRTDYFRHFRYLPYFLAGTCLYFYERGYRLSSLAGLAISFLGILHEAQHPAHSDEGYAAWKLAVGVFLGCGSIWALSQCNLGAGKWKYLDKKMGDLSYPVYLINLVVATVCTNLFQSRNFGIWFLAIAMTVFLAAFINRYVEGSLKRFRDQIRGASL